MNNSIFREYDIRGIAEKDLTNEVVELIGLAYGTKIIESGLQNISIGIREVGHYLITLKRI